MRTRPPRSAGILRLAVLGSVLGVLAGFGVVRSNQVAGGTDNAWELASGVLDGRHFVILLIIPVVGLAGVRVGSDLRATTVWVRLGSRTEVALQAARTGAIAGVIVWAASMTGFLTQLSPMSWNRNSAVTVVIGSLAAQFVVIAFFSSSMAAVASRTRALALVLLWLAPASMMVSLVAPDRLPTFLRPHHYLNESFWSDGLWLALSSAVGLVLVSAVPVRRWLSAHLFVLAILGGVAIFAALAVGIQEDPRTVSEGLVRAFAAVGPEGLGALALFGLMVVSLAPGVGAAILREGRYPEMAHLLRIRGLPWPHLIGREIRTVVLLAALCSLLTGVVQVAVLIWAGVEAEGGPTTRALMRIMVVGGTQALSYGLLGLLASAWSRSTAAPIVVMATAAATTPVVAIWGWWPAGQGSTGLDLGWSGLLVAQTMLTGVCVVIVLALLVSPLKERSHR